MIKIVSLIYLNYRFVFINNRTFINLDMKFIHLKNTANVNFINILCNKAFLMNHR